MAPLRPLVLFSGVDMPDFSERLRALAIDAYRVQRAAPNAGQATVGLLDVYGDFGALYGLERDFLCLIRPDGHVGLFLSRLRLTDFAGYLALVCDPAHVRDVFDAGRRSTSGRLRSPDPRFARKA